MGWKGKQTQPVFSKLFGLYKNSEPRNVKKQK